MSSLPSGLPPLPSFLCHSFKAELSEPDLAKLELFSAGQYNADINKLVFVEIRHILREIWGNVEFAYQSLFKKVAMLVDAVDLLGGDEMFPTQKVQLSWRSSSNENAIQTTGRVTKHTLDSMEQVLQIWLKQLSKDSKFIKLINNTMRNVVNDGNYLVSVKKFRSDKDLEKVCYELNKRLISVEGDVKDLKSDYLKMCYKLESTELALRAAVSAHEKTETDKDMMEEALIKERQTTRFQIRETRQRLDREIKRRILDEEFWL